MNITPYSISETTKISEAYSNNVYQNAVPQVSIPLKPSYKDVSFKSIPTEFPRGLNLPPNTSTTDKQTFIGPAPKKERKFYIGSRKNPHPDWVANRLGNGVVDGLVIAAPGGAVANLGKGAKLLKGVKLADLGKGALNGVNVWGNYELIKDVYDKSPELAVVGAALAAKYPRQSLKVLNSPWTTGGLVGYYVGQGVWDGYQDAINSQSSAGQQTSANTNKQPTTSNDKQQPQPDAGQPITPKVDQQPFPSDVDVDSLRKSNTMVGQADYQGYSISDGGTNNVGRAVYDALGQNLKLAKTPRFAKEFPKLPPFVNEYEKYLQQLNK